MQSAKTLTGYLVHFTIDSDCGTCGCAGFADLRHLILQGNLIVETMTQLVAAGWEIVGVAR